MQATKVLPVYNRKSCRLCGSMNIVLALPMKPSPIGDAYITREELDIDQPSYPLSLYLCEECGHLQLPCVIDPQHLFGNYIYRTSTSPGLVEHFKQYADDIEQRGTCFPDALAIEIGSNDGTLLKFFKEKNMRVLGIDPAKNIAAEATIAGVETLPSFFTYALAKEIKEKYGAAHIVAANNVFAHIDNMEDLIKGIQHLLAPEGIFVFEASYLIDMFEKNVFDTIYHEHLSYHRIAPLEKFFNKFGMNFFDIKRINTKGGSIRGYVKLQNSTRPVDPVVMNMILLEREMKLDQVDMYKNFSDHLSFLERELKQVLDNIKLAGKSIISYGASPPVTTTTHQFELGSYLDYIVDDNRIKQGRYSPGQHLPIFPSDVIYEKKPDYILILAWQYADMIIKKHQKFLENGGHFIVPLPKVYII